jgi:hypothetical protein
MTATATESKTPAQDGTVEEPKQAAKKEKRAYVFTPFQAMKEANDRLEQEGLAANLQGPMLYSYAKQGRFGTHPAQCDIDAGAEKPRLEVDEDSFHEWLDKYVSARKNGTKVAKAEAEVKDDADEAESDDGEDDDLDELDEESDDEDDEESDEDDDDAEAE